MAWLQCCATVGTEKASSSRIPQRRATITPSAPELKSEIAFKKTYKSQGQINDSETLSNVRHVETGFSYVCRSLSKDNAPCKDPEIINEHLQKLNGLEHPHLCKFVEAFDDGDTIHLIYEKADPMTLFEYIQSLRSFVEDDAAEYTRQILMALAVTHEQGVVHGRLNPSSLILSPEGQESDSEAEGDEELAAQVKIADMGQAFVLRPTTLEKMSDLECMPPEVAWDEVHTRVAGNIPYQAHKMDIWGLGCVVYYMLTGHAPYHATTKEGLVETIKTRPVEFGNEFKGLHEDACDAVDCMLKMNASLRPSASAMLRHPWVRLDRERIAKGRMLRLLTNLRENTAEGQFKRMVMRVVAQQLPHSLPDVGLVERAFRSLDKNGDGCLDVKEICAGIRKYQDCQNMDSELEDLFALLDRDGSGTVNAQEFMSGGLKQSRVLTNYNLWNAFNAFDKDRNGSVDIDEIERIVRHIEAGLLGKEQVDELVKAIREELKDVTSGSTIDFDQFLYLMRVKKGARIGQAVQRDIYRIMHKCFGVDCYDVRRLKPKEWGWEASPRSPLSVYRRVGIGAERQARRRSSTGMGMPSPRGSTANQKDGSKSPRGPQEKREAQRRSSQSSGSKSPKGTRPTSPRPEAGKIANESRGRSKES